MFVNIFAWKKCAKDAKIYTEMHLLGTKETKLKIIPKKLTHKEGKQSSIEEYQNKRRLLQ